MRYRWLLPFRILKDAGWKFLEDDGLFIARGLAFGILIYCIPLALLAVSAMSYTLISSEGAIQWIRNLVEAFAPQFQEDFRESMASIVSNRGILGAAGFVTFVFVSSATFGSLRGVLNRVFRAPEPRGIIRGKLMSIVMMLITSALLFIVIGALYILALAQSVISGLPWLMNARHTLALEFPGLATILDPAALWFTYGLTFLLTTGLFWFLYRYAPAQAPHRQALMVGALTAATLFEFSKAAFAWYVAYAQTTTMLYGTLSGAIFLLFWLYYASAIFVFGAEVSWVFDRLTTANAGRT